MIILHFSAVVQFCEVLQSPGNGLVVQTGTIENSVATYTCDVGYIQDGPMTRGMLPPSLECGLALNQCATVSVYYLSFSLFTASV